MSNFLRPPTLCGAGDVLYLKEDQRDIYVIVKSDVREWKFPAHKLVLSSESAIFRAKFEDDSVNDLVLTDISPSTVEHLLKYMYCGKLEVENWDEAVDLLDTAFKYVVHDLIKHCGKFLEEVISLSNVCHIYEKATEYNLNNLQDKCLKLILEAGFIVLKSDAFETLNKKCVLNIVSSPELNVDSERMVFETLFRWARMECCKIGLPTTENNILNQIEPFLKHLCIDDMSDTDKSALPPAILACVQPNNRNRIGHCIPPALKDYSKSVMFEIDSECLCFISDNLSAICFTVDTIVHLIAFSMYIGTSPQTIHLKISLIKETAPQMTMFCQVKSLDVTDDGSLNTLYPMEVMLKQPVILKPGEVYNIFVSNSNMEVQLPKSRFTSVKIPVASGILNLTVYDLVWGISNLIVI